MKLFVAFSHVLMEDQIKDLPEGTEIVHLSEDMKKEFSQIPATWSIEEIKKFSNKIVQEALDAGCDYMFCTGEPSVFFWVNTIAATWGIQCIQSTTKRDNKETVQPDGSVVKTQIFRHVMWRRLL